ncbi:hypothetical protein AB1L42_18725 [Thalassoglobus sp. JC818]|uniref:hypothetical protein n=1 Tax=Thalassoglobus sp. JC818 TaxID=3232136 RepID=UPI0034596170
MEQIRRRLWSLYVVEQVLRSLTMLVLGWAFLGVIDWWIQPESPAIRSLLSIAFWTCFLGCVFWLFRSLYVTRISTIDTALTLEGVSPRLAGKLATPLAFEQSSVPLKSDSDWQQHIQSGVNDLKLEAEAVPLRIWPVACASLVIAFSLLSLSVLYADRIQIASQRLINPGSETIWPKTTRFQIFDKQNKPIITGSTIFVDEADVALFRIIDLIGELPEEVWVETLRGNSRHNRFRPRSTDVVENNQSRQELEFSLFPSSTKTTLFRVVGGDDQSSAWTTVKWRSRPRLVDSVCFVAGPDYLQFPEQELRHWAGPIDVVAGSTLKMSFTFDQPLESFQVRDRSDRSVIRSEVVDGSTTFSFDWQVPPQFVGLLSLELLVQAVVPDQTVSYNASPILARTITLNSTSDLAPVVAISDPRRDQTLTPQASFQLLATANDDFGMQSIEGIIEGGTSKVLPGKLSSDRRNGEVKVLLSVDELGLSPGDQVTLSCRAMDARPESTPTVSEPIQLSIVSDDEMRQLLASELTKVTRTIIALSTLQPSLRTRLEPLLALFENGEKLQSEETNELISLIAQQELTTERLATEVLSNGLESIHERLLQNQIGDSPLTEAVVTAIETLKPLEDGTLVNLQSRLDLIRQETRSRSSLPLLSHELPNVRDNLAEIVRDQAEIERTLRQALQNLESWVDSKESLEQWRLVIAKLRTLMDELRVLGASTLGLPVDAVSQTQRTQLNGLADRHLELGEALENFARQHTTGNSRNRTLGQIPDGDQILRLHPLERMNRVHEFILDNNIVTAMDSDNELLELLLSLANAEKTQRQLTDGELLTAVNELKQHLDAIHAERRQLAERWQNFLLGKPGLADAERQIEQQLEDVTQRADELDLLELKQLVAGVISLQQQLLESLDAKSHSEVQQSLDDLVTKLEESVDALDRVQQRLNLQEQRNRLRALCLRAGQLVRQQQEIRLALPNPSSDHKLSRAERRHFVEQSGLEFDLRNELNSLATEADKLPVLQQLLNSLSGEATATANRLRNFQFDDHDSLALQWIESTLETISQLSPADVSVRNSTNDSQEDASDEMTGWSIELVAQLQEQLHRDTQDWVSSGILALDENDPKFDSDSETRLRLLDTIGKRQSEIAKLLESMLDDQSETENE